MPVRETEKASGLRPQASGWKTWALVAVSGSAIGLAACEKVTNLDLAYGAAAEAGADAPSADGGPGPGAEFEGCPCDESAGLGCCVPKVGPPFCTASSTFCASEQGIHLKCLRPDSLTESACCWHGLDGVTSAGALTALASTCDGGAPACTLDEHCAGTGKKCALAACGPATLGFGRCADTPPPCP
jgi:hypothetical protein